MSQALEVKHCSLEIKRNSSSHKTALFPGDRLIVRRGQPFNIVLHLESKSRLLDETSHMLTVETGWFSQTEPSIKVSFDLWDTIIDTDWSSSATEDQSRNTISVTINSAPNAPIGKYSLTLDQEGKTTKLGDFILLFNPWCPRDAVFMSSETKRQEYVLAQNGLIYEGSSNDVRRKFWNFGQFEDEILDSCLLILDRYQEKDISLRNSPVHMSRMLSAMINSNDDSGVVVGSWDSYPNGTDPLMWNGSGKILRQWAESGPVRYGQCWVFAAVACTVARALGIPCRVVTNFDSAHDSNGDLLIQTLYDENYKRISTSDSMWNFHCWDECWMTRPDLDPGYDGWQVVDPTPQEKSEGIYRCGPAPVKAIHEGELTKKYDAPFIFAEVNADVEDLMRLSNGRIVKLQRITDSSGHLISTKTVGSYDRHDITHQYKYPEGSAEERRVFEKAQHRNKLREPEKEPMLHLMITVADKKIVGSDFEVFVVLTNKATKAKTCTLHFYAKAANYNGRTGEDCGNFSEKVQLPAGGEKRLPFKIEYEKYGSLINSDHLIRVSVFVSDEPAGEYYKADKNIVLDKPEIEIKLLGETRVNKTLTAELTLLNPLPEALQDCSFTLENTGLFDKKPITRRIGVVGPNQAAKARIDLIPLNAGPSMLLANFQSQKLSIKNFIEVNINQ